MRSNVLAGAGLVLVLALLGLVPSYTRAHVEADPEYQPHEVEAAKESIALSLLGQLQLSVGDLMWLKSMEYLHMGMVQRMPTRAEEAQGMMRGDSGDTAIGLGHTEGVNMTLDPERDWRGILGTIERHVKPYRPGHAHDDPVELIPWYQLAVKINPRLERLYTLGAFYMADFAHDPGEAYELLITGIHANPNSFEIHAALGRLLVDYAHRLHELEHDDEEHGEEDFDLGPELEEPEDAFNYAVEVLHKATELGDMHRQELARRRQVWDEFQHQMFGEAYLYLSKAYVGLGRYEEAVEIAETGFETATGYASRNLLRVQQRIALRHALGEMGDESDVALLERASALGMRGEARAENGVRGRAHEDEPARPLFDVLDVTPPEQLLSPSQFEALHTHLLQDIRSHPYEGVQARAVRLSQSDAAVREHLADLQAMKFIVESVEGSGEHALTPMGLYVALGHFGWDFWQAMEREQGMKEVEHAY